MVFLMMSVCSMQGSIVSEKNVQCRYFTNLMKQISRGSNSVHVQSDAVGQLLFAQMFQEEKLDVSDDTRLLISRYYALALYASYGDEAQKVCRNFFAENNADAWLESLQLFDQHQGGNKSLFLALAAKLGISSPSQELINNCCAAACVAKPTHLLMTQGGDDRLHLDSATGVNKYHTSSIPLLDEISRSSCTSSRPRQAAFNAAENMRQKMLQEMLAGNNTVCSSATANVRQRIKTILGLSDSVHAIVTPSGSDAEMVFSLIAMSNHHGESVGSRVCNIVVAGGEVGSGTAGAAGGRHFSKFTPLGPNVAKGDFVAGFSEADITVVQCATRDSNTGQVVPKNMLEERLEKMVVQAIEAHHQTVVLHMVHSSKTSVGTPSIAFLEKMKDLYGDRIIIVIDAAQCRFSSGTLQKLLDKDFCILATGSKFFAGAPFSGVCLVPDSQAGALKQGVTNLPVGIREYFSAYDVDDALVGFKKQLPDVCNVGLLLRWETALFEMEQLTYVDEEIKNKIVHAWVSGIQKLMHEYRTFVRLEDALTGHYLAEEGFVLAQRNTVASFVVRKGDGWFTVPELKIIHKLMSLDLSDKLPASASQDEKSIAQVKCLIGQPVTIMGETGVLRVALSAPMISAMYKSATGKSSGTKWAVQKALLQDEQVLDKLDLIVRYFEQLV